MVTIKCKKCGKEDGHHSKGLCYYCYRKFIWKPRKIICKRCKKEKPYHSKNLCPGCYSFLFRSNQIKAFNFQKYHNINYESYKKLTKKCILCGFEKVVELHHLDENKENNSEANLVGLCPNHHKMLHDFKFRGEVRQLLKEKGFSLPKDERLDFSLEDLN